MNCPEPSHWLLLSLGELSVNESSELERHREDCPRCRAACRECQSLLDDLGSAPALASSDEAFTARVLEACARAPTPSASAKITSRGRRMLAGGVVAAAAAALVALAPWRAADVREERWTARGKIHTADAIGPAAALFFVRGGVARPLAGAALAPGDGILVRADNPGAVPAFLAVLAVDAAGVTHWIHPAYLDPSDNPASITLAPHLSERALDEVVEPEAPAPGEFRVFTLFTREPLRVRDVEARLRGARTAAEVAAQIPQAKVREWSAAWTK